MSCCPTPGSTRAHNNALRPPTFGHLIWKVGRTGEVLGITWASLGHQWESNRTDRRSRCTMTDTQESDTNQDRQENFLSTPNGIRTRAATLKGWCPRPLDDGGLFVPCRAWWSGCPDLNRGPLRPERSALTKLRYSPRQVSPQPDNPTRRGQPQPTASSTGAWRSTTISLIRRFSMDWTLRVQFSKA